MTTALNPAGAASSAASDLVSADIAGALRDAFGADLCITQADDTTRWSADPWGLYAGVAAAVMLPRNVEQVSKIVRFCAQRAITLVPQGGNTGLVGGGIPDASGRQVVLSLSRMNAIREVDAANYTMTVDAGCILVHVQEEAAKAARLFPLSFGAEGSCQIGGVLSSNAGGSGVLRYGNARDLVLGIEAVLADGTIWHGLRKLRKDNTGYDLKHLFIGAEGTMGIITAAVLKLFPKPRATATTMLALSGLDATLGLLALARDMMGDALSAFELIPRRLVTLAAQHTGSHMGNVKCVPDVDAEWFALLEFAGADTQDILNVRVQALLEAALAADKITDGSVATTLAQRRDMWHLRDGVAETQIANGAVIYFDVSVPVSAVPSFIRQATQALRIFDPQVDVNAFGHAGDGNVHFNLLQPSGMSAADFLAHKPQYEDIVYDTVYELDGSFSAEHGIGSAKTAALVQYKAEIELDMMRAVRAALSNTLFNPGKLVPLR